MLPYDGLDAEAQGVVRAGWTARMGELRNQLDLAGSFAASNRSWVELDADGSVVERC